MSLLTRIKRAWADESGLTLMELIATIPIFLAVTAAIGIMVTTGVHNSDRTVQRVDANQRVRPVMTRVVQELHSACVAARIVPVLAGSTGTSISFLSKSGSAVTPVPDMHVISLSAGTLTDVTYPSTGGAAPTWTFSATPSSTYRMMTNVAAPAGVVFRYYQFVNGVLSTTPLTTPLSATDAAHTANVDVSLASQPSRGVSTLDPNSPLIVNDSADLRLEAAGQYPNQDNLPCV
jgi:hypothetical protein